mmetsp:Transcript_7120/g.15040  ORF Transcript_7120/g.15040 Transcript_7120/m.15040 type:complete len:216 (-) Transcript_7120:437-1084(-)
MALHRWPISFASFSNLVSVLTSAAFVSSPPSFSDFVSSDLDSLPSFLAELSPSPSSLLTAATPSIAPFVPSFAVSSSAASFLATSPPASADLASVPPSFSLFFFSLTRSRFSPPLSSTVFTSGLLSTPFFFSSSVGNSSLMIRALSSLKKKLYALSGRFGLLLRLVFFDIVLLDLWAAAADMCPCAALASETALIPVPNRLRFGLLMIKSTTEGL